jgi:hypothetical protein
MKLFMPSSDSTADWLIFLAILLAVGIGITCFIVWFVLLRKSGGQRKRRRQRKHRHVNPTLAQTGGLPPVRNPGQPPRGV